MDAHKTYGEQTWQQLHKNDASNVKQVMGATPYKTTAVRPPATHHEKYSS